MASKAVSVSKMERKCESVSCLLKALSHPERLMILGHLSGGPKTVTDLVEVTDVSQPQMSQFLARMKLEGLVTCERKGRFQYYSLADAKVAALMTAIQSIFC